MASIPQGMSTRGLAQSVDVSGTIAGVFKFANTRIVKLTAPDGSTIVVDAALVPGGADWASSHTGTFVQVRSIVRELSSGPKR